jgi:hypothetical protein
MPKSNPPALRSKKKYRLVNAANRRNKTSRDCNCRERGNPGPALCAGKRCFTELVHAACPTRARLRIHRCHVTISYS